MSVQNVSGKPLPDGRLSISWETLADHRAVSIQVAFNPEFTANRRHFLLPAGTGSCALDLGTGAWFVRCGAWIGDVHRGTIEWSGIYGPFLVRSPRGVVAVPAERLKVTQIQSLESGMRFHTERMEEYYALVEHKKSNPAGPDGWNYVRDVGVGHIDVVGLPQGHTYTFRVYDCGGAALPTDQIFQLGAGVVVENRSVLPTGRSLNVGDFSDHKGEQAILRDAADKRVVRFSSQAEYLKYVAAKAKTTGARQLV